MVENGVLSQIFGPKRDDVTGGWRKLRSEYLTAVPSIIMITKSDGMTWVGHVARIGM
jgi:hypothetical protein